MPKQVAPVEVSSFVAGLITDASPLTFPDNASLSEDNFILNTDGSRNRRLGMDVETGGSEISTGITYSSSNTYGHSTFRWSNAGFDSSVSLLVVQFGNEIKFFNLGNAIITSEVIDTHTFAAGTSERTFSYAVVDSILTVATGEADITSFEYDVATNTISSSTSTLKVRDLFGLGVTISSSDLKDGNNIAERPATINDSHKYNLRNQSWAEPRRASNTETDLDPITHFFSTAAVYPSNSDSVNKALYPDANDTDNRVVDRFFAGDLQTNRYGSTHAPVGHYIIDALDRGVSRAAAYQTTIDQNPTITMLDITSLPTDRTEGGASVVEQYAGRVFYAGFNGELSGGDDLSPRLSSYIMFSKRVENVSDTVKCYQEGDPTSIDEPDLLETDGGFIRIDGAYGIKSLISLGDALFVIASNGVWSIVGDNSSGFTATSYLVRKITYEGCDSPRSVVIIEGGFMFWGEDGIYAVTQNKFGDWVAENISDNRVSILFNSFSSDDVEKVEGLYDEYGKKVHWLINNRIADTDDVREIIYDINLSAFYTKTVYTPTGTTYPKVICAFTSNPFTLGSVDDQVVVGGDPVQASAVNVVVPVTLSTSTTRDIQYICVTDTATVIKYKACLYKDNDWVDWVTVDGTGVDAAAHMVTGYLSGGDFQRQKQITHMTVYSRKTEDGYTTDVNGDFVPTNESSCLVQTQWDWTNSANSNRWGTQFQAYRHRRAYFPVDITDEYEDGHAVVVSRNKLRGKGRVLSIKFSTEAGKDLHLYGWSMILAATSSV